MISALPISRPILYIDMDNVLVDFQSGINRLSKYEKREYEGRYDEVPNIFAKCARMKEQLMLTII